MQPLQGLFRRTVKHIDQRIGSISNHCFINVVISFCHYYHWRHSAEHETPAYFTCLSTRSRTGIFVGHSERLNLPRLVCSPFCYDDDDAIIGTIGSYFSLNALLDTEYHRTKTLWFSGEKRSIYVAREREREGALCQGDEGDETTRT